MPVPDSLTEEYVVPESPTANTPTDRLKCAGLYLVDQGREKEVATVTGLLEAKAEDTEPVLKELQRKKILSAPDAQKRQVLNHKLLHQLWESSFIHKLRPRLQIERCSPTHPWRIGSIPSLIKTSKLEEDVILGGELAAAFYCDHIEARRATLHVERKRALKLMLQLRLTPDPEGCIDVVANFSPAIAFPQRSAEGLLSAEPYLVHAELMSTEEQQTLIAHQLAQEYFPF